MKSRSEEGLYGALESALQVAKEPLDCTTLFKIPSVCEHAPTVNRVSDYLGNLWRKGVVLRIPAPRLEGTRAQWLYAWKDKGIAKGQAKKKPWDLRKAIPYHPGVEAVLNRPTMEITEEDGTVVLTLPSILITIKPNPQQRR